MRCYQATCGMASDTLLSFPALQLEVPPKFWKSSIAVIVGNLLYFFWLRPLLPPAARHRPGRLDLGLFVDFWICVVLFALLDLIGRKFHPFRGHSDGH